MTAPGLPTADPTAPPRRPETIRLAVQLWVAVIVFQIVAVASRFNVLKASYEKQARELSDRMNEPSLTENMGVTVLVGIVVIVVLLTAVAALLMWFTYSGRTWARLLLGWVSAFLTVELVFAVIGLFVDTQGGSDLPEAPAWGMVPTILGGVCAVGALAALMHRDSAAFCREVAAYRSRNRQNGAR
ncbi:MULTISPECIES: hypothetical protein [Gordonia]|uniref:Uncharacterized protein n=2 Tax=Gordonia TaxID=2053 RepID=L7LGE0_9ACTN|nr:MULTISPECIES: hypothetical protein [Gordonia]AUH67060.1 hypothetical protein CXX93_00120 [Gordonia sp. YC-JH1]KJR06357.1 hypothetical protein UG54_13895 [Gordonia sihwensis]KXT58580.1 hypothetical protein Y710_03390 [Gordonia sp. QH-12]MBY4569194.1 hypothetical protein [Gordonia sihwensis]WFN93301.1 hypothetical protein P5P27_01610 [Gordonia sihwensis]